MPHAIRDRFIWAALVIVALAALLEFSRPINHDVAWILTVADLMHMGRHLYTDIIEINPPLIFWAASGMRAVAKLLHVAPETVYRVITLMLGLGSALAVRRFTASVWPALALLAGGLILVGADFGQRDVLTAFLLAPYVAMAASRSIPRNAWLIGVLAGMGLCLKPFYLGVWLLLLPWNRARAADMALLVTGALYLISVPVFAPAFLSFARALGPAYSEWLRPPWTGALHSMNLLPVLGLSALTLLARRRLPAWGSGFVLAATGAGLAMLMQGKPFSYQAQPALMFDLAAAAAFITLRVRTLAIAGMVLAAAVISKSTSFWMDSVGRQTQQSRILRLVEQWDLPPHSVVLSEFLSHGPPVFRAVGRPWSLSAPNLWWLSATAGALPDSVRRSLAERTADEIADADAVVVDRVARGDSTAPTFLLHLTREPAIAHALAQFPSVDTVGLLLRYRRVRPHAVVSDPTE